MSLPTGDTAPGGRGPGADAPGAATHGTGLELDHLHCLRDHRALFADLNLKVGPGQLLWIRGVNGAGKTSLLRMICGLLLPTQGCVRWHGKDVAELREEFGRALVYLGHAAALKSELSALENLLAALTLGAIAASAADAVAALGDAGLRGRERALVRTLSQGQRRRAALARLVLAGASPLWVLDEPFNALDAAATAWLSTLIAAHVARGGIVVLTSHQSVTLPDAVPQITVSL
ncbi:MAG: cytochrome c biogenesis heme-transporting ATPase CcmA [Burkholderiaceae bacterium]